mmetsp:Transcript_9810/g.8370  ORF Transcript_9810/g.8370 Transcript_9810/m.8370 type:complete len:301 (+) Transcript_9810:53-955(+)
MEQLTQAPKVITFKYEEILNKNSELSERIEQAFGPNGLGLCLVEGVPEFVEKRQALLPLASKLADLPKEQLDKIEFPDQHYSLGWSHGKESFKGKKDFAKGSFYAVAQEDEHRPNHGDRDQEKEIDPFPKSLPELKPAFKSLGQLIINTGIKLTHHIDKYVAKKCPNYDEHKLEDIITEADNIIGRLLHYFPQDKKSEHKDGWCGIHNDLGSLTGLCPAMYLDKDGKETTFIDEETGLYCIGRDGKHYKVKIPKNCLAFQIGETFQIHTGGHVVATPHYVKVGDKMAGTGICRNTLAVFM